MPLGPSTFTDRRAMPRRAPTLRPSARLSLAASTHWPGFNAARGARLMLGSATLLLSQIRTLASSKIWMLESDVDIEWPAPLAQ